MSKKILVALIFILSFHRNIVAEELSNIFMEDYINIEEANRMAKEVVLAQEIGVRTLDPVKVNDTYSRRVLFLIYDTLFTIDEIGVVKPNLAKNYKWLNEQELYIELRDNIEFHNGDIMTAQDVKFTLERLKEYGKLENVFSSIEGVEVLNKRELIINLKFKDSLLLSSLANPIAGIVKIKDRKIYGSGAYKIVSKNQANIKLEKNIKHFKKKGIIEKIELKSEPNSTQRVIDLLNRDDNVVYDLYAEDLIQAKNSGIIDKDIEIYSEHTVDTIAMVFGDMKVFDTHDRIALEKAIQRKADTFFPNEIVKQKLAVINTEYKLSTAKEFIKKANIKEINIMVLNTRYNLEVAKKVKGNLENAGIKVNILPHNSISFHNKLYSGDFEVAIYNITLTKNYPLASLERIFSAEVRDEEIRDALVPLINLMKEEKNYDKRYAIFDKVLALMYNNHIYIPLEHKQTYIIGKKNNVDEITKLIYN